MADKKVYKDEKGHFTNKENDGGPCHHDTGSGKSTNKYKGKSIADLDKEGFEGWHNEIIQNLRNSSYDSVDAAMEAGRKRGFDQNQMDYIEAYAKQVFGEDFDDDYDEEFGDNNEESSADNFDKEPDDYEKIQKQIGNFNKLYDSIQYAGYDKLDELEDDVENAYNSEEISDKDYEKLTEMLTEKRLTGEYDEIRKSAREQDEAMRARLKTGNVHGEGNKATAEVEDVKPATKEDKAKWKKEDDDYGEQLKKKYGWDVLPEGYENMSEEEIVNAQKSKEEPYKAKYDYEDFEDARFYPTKSTMDGSRWVGRYRGIAEAHGLDRYNDYKGFNEKFKPVGDYKGTSIFQLPDGYFSINPNITSMSFKTKEALQDYLDKKNPEEHKFGLYYDGDVQKMYEGVGEDGKRYGIEGPDAYKAARNKSKVQQEKSDRFNNSVGRFIEGQGSDQELDEMLSDMRKDYSDEEIIKKLAMMFKGTIK